MLPKRLTVCAREKADHLSCPVHSSLVGGLDPALPLHIWPGTIEHGQTSDWDRRLYMQAVIVACNAALAAKPGHWTALKLRASANMQLKRFEVGHDFQNLSRPKFGPCICKVDNLLLTAVATDRAPTGSVNPNPVAEITAAHHALPLRSAADIKFSLAGCTLGPERCAGPRI